DKAGYRQFRRFTDRDTLLARAGYFDLDLEEPIVAIEINAAAVTGPERVATPLLRHAISIARIRQRRHPDLVAPGLIRRIRDQIAVGRYVAAVLSRARQVDPGGRRARLQVEQRDAVVALRAQRQIGELLTIRSP